MVLLFNLKRKKLVDYKDAEALNQLYYLTARLPTDEELMKSGQTAARVRDQLSRIQVLIPLVDPRTQNMYLIHQKRVFYRVEVEDYRFPNENVIAAFDSDLEAASESPLLERKKRKLALIRRYLSSFDTKRLYLTYRVVYDAEMKAKDYLTAAKNPAHLPGFSHIKPFYTREEMLARAKNATLIDPKIGIEDVKMVDLNRISKKLVGFEIDSSLLQRHQTYLIESKIRGLLDYYSLTGAYYFNRYLRGQTEYRNPVLEEMIGSLTNVMKRTPALKRGSIVYRFLNDDSHLSHLKIGDRYQSNSFLSTTRDHFYRLPGYDFGSVVVKINLPKGKIGMVTAIELLSHFPEEAELLIPPGAIMKLISRDQNTVYYDSDRKRQNHRVVRYEFDLLSIGEYSWPDKPDQPLPKPFDLRKWAPIDGVSGKSRIARLFAAIADERQIATGTLERERRFILHRHDSRRAYRKMYAQETDDGFSICSFGDNFIDLFVELVPWKDKIGIEVNYYFRHSTSDTQIGDRDLLPWIAELARVVSADRVRIYSNYTACHRFAQMPQKYLSLDSYRYLKYRTKRFYDEGFNRDEVEVGFDYELFDQWKHLAPTEILRRGDRDDLYAIYRKEFLGQKGGQNLRDFYLWLFDEMCDLIELFGYKLYRITGMRLLIDSINYIFHWRKYLSRHEVSRGRGVVPKGELLPEKNRYRLEETSRAD